MKPVIPRSAATKDPVRSGDERLASMPESLAALGMTAQKRRSFRS